MAQPVSLGRGMDFLRNQQSQMGSRTFGSGYKKLWLSDGDTAIFWFITDMDDVIVPLVHGASMTSKRGKKFSIDVLCPKSSLDAPCPLGDRCISNEKEIVDGEEKYKYPGPFPRPVFYVFVEKIYHTSPDADGKWEKATSGNSVLYREDVNEVYLLIAKQKMGEQIEIAYNGDPTEIDFDTRTPTLKDRVYKIRVTGKQQQRQDILSAAGQVVAEQPAIVMSTAAELPTLEDTVIKEFGHQLTDTLPGRDSYSETTTTTTTVAEVEDISEDELEPLNF